MADHLDMWQGPEMLPGNAAALLQAIKLIHSLIFPTHSILPCTDLVRGRERQLQMAICIKSSPVTPD